VCSVVVVKVRQRIRFPLTAIRSRRLCSRRGRVGWPILQIYLFRASRVFVRKLSISAFWLGDLFGRWLYKFNKKIINRQTIFSRTFETYGDFSVFSGGFP
jgi:hypothetical protein